MDKFIKIIIFITCFSFLIVFPFLAEAKLVPCGQTDAPKCQLCHIFLLIRNIATVALEIIVPLTALLIVIGGIAILTAAGSTERAAKGKKAIYFAVIGIAVAFGTWVVINSVIVLLVNPDIFPGPWNAWKLECPVVTINPEEATTTSYTVLNDADNSGNASPGDTLRYSFSYTNTSSENLSDLVITSDYDQNHIFLITNISEGGTDDDNKITWKIGNLKSNQSVTVSYDFILGTDFSDLLGKAGKSNILDRIAIFFSQKALAQTQTIYLQNIITITSNQAEAETMNDPITVTVSAAIVGDPEDIPNNPAFLVGYYGYPESCDTVNIGDSKWLQYGYSWAYDKLEGYGLNAIRIPFYGGHCENNPPNWLPFYAVSPWINNDCGQPNDDYYDWFRSTIDIDNANSKGIYAILTLYIDDWPCDNKTQANREKTYDKIINYLGLPKDKVIIEINWEPEVVSDNWMQEQAKYFQDRGIPTIITDHHYNDNLGATGINTYAGRHRDWDRDTSLRYFDSGKPTIWTERFFWLPDEGGREPMTHFEGREHIYKDSLTIRQSTLFYYIRWGYHDASSIEKYLEDAGYAVKLAKKIPWKAMVPQERYNQTVSNKGYWAIKSGEAALGWVNGENEIEIDITGWSGEYNYWWYNPRNGKFQYIDTISDPGHKFTVSTPNSKDWIFVLRSEEITITPIDPICGDGQCSDLETCSSCPEDCGPCVVETGCQTNFKMAYIYLYEPTDHIPENFERLKRAKSFHEDIFNKAGRGRVTLDLSYPIASIEITDSNRDRLLHPNKNGPLGNLKDREITKEFYRNHPDDFDFISIYTNFHIREGAGVGYFHSTIQNRIKGIGRAIFDNSHEFGNQEKLLGYNYLGDINHTYSQEMLEEHTEEKINCMNAVHGLVHETTHQWTAYIGDKYGEDDDLILQNSWGGHWFQGLNIGYDPVGGGRWKDNGDGTFTLLEPNERCAPRNPSNLLLYGIGKLSDLTLYLIGAIEANQVEPILWIDYDGPLSPGTTISAESKYITIQDIVAKEGERICPTPTISCTDSDDGLNYLKYGECKGKDDEVKKDKCSKIIGLFKTNKLIEYSCSEEGSCEKVKINCKEEFGEDYVCRNGACLNTQEQCYEIYMDVAGKDCNPDIPSEMSVSIDVLIGGKYRVKGQVVRDQWGFQCQDGENFRLEVGGEFGPVSFDNEDPCVSTDETEYLGEFNFNSGSNTIIMHHTGQCPPDASSNSVELKKICLYPIVD